MTLDFSGFDRPECKNSLNVRDVARHADLWAITYLCSDNRALVAHLLDFANGLMTAALTLSQIFLYDGYHGHDDHVCGSDCFTGLTEAQRLQVLTLASTCAHNATLFMEEAQRRRIRRAAPGWDPITTPITA